MLSSSSLDEALRPFRPAVGSPCHGVWHADDRHGAVRTIPELHKPRTSQRSPLPLGPCIGAASGKRLPLHSTPGERRPLDLAPTLSPRLRPHGGARQIPSGGYRALGPCIGAASGKRLPLHSTPGERRPLDLALTLSPRLRPHGGARQIPSGGYRALGPCIGAASGKRLPLHSTPGERRPRDLAPTLSPRLRPHGGARQIPSGGYRALGPCIGAASGKRLPLHSTAGERRPLDLAPTLSPRLRPHGGARQIPSGGYRALGPCIGAASGKRLPLHSTPGERRPRDLAPTLSPRLRPHGGARQIPSGGYRALGPCIGAASGKRLPLHSTPGAAASAGRSISRRRSRLAYGLTAGRARSLQGGTELSGPVSARRAARGFPCTARRASAGRSISR
eukprot:tig00021244_g19597.t1